MTKLLRNKKTLVIICLTAVLLTIGLTTYFIAFYNKVKEKPASEIIVSEQPTRVVIYGDTRTGDDIHRKITDAIIGLAPDVVFHVGDMVDDGNKIDQWTNFSKIADNLIATTKYYALLGNHEKNSINFYNKFSFPGNEQWYSVDTKNAHFVVLNSNKDYSLGSEQYLWLENDLSSLKSDIKHRFVLLHQPVFSTGNHYLDNVKVQNFLKPLFDKYAVTAVFAGHDHDYERSYVDGIYYFVVGGGGAPLDDQKTTSPYSQKYLKSYNYSLLGVSKDKVTVTVYDENSKIIDEISL